MNCQQLLLNNVPSVQKIEAKLGDLMIGSQTQSHENNGKKKQNYKFAISSFKVPKAEYVIHLSIHLSILGLPHVYLQHHLHLHQQPQ